MVKKTLCSGLFFFLLLLCHAQEEVAPKIEPPQLDTLNAAFFEIYPVNFDVSQKSGCEYLITQLLNLTEYPPEDSLSFVWNVFNDDQTIDFVYTDEDPDIFLHEPGNYHIQLKVTNRQGEVDSLLKFNAIAIDTMPHINFTYTPENALFAEYLGEVEFINLTDPVYQNDSAIFWYWDMGDHVVNTKEWSPVHLFSSWGDYYTTFHLETKNGCKVAMTKTVTIEDELFFPEVLYKDARNSSSVFAVTNLNTHLPVDDPNGFRTNHLFIYNEQGEIVYEQKNYDTYKKKDITVEGVHAFDISGLDEGIYYYSFYYQGKNKMVHYSGELKIGN